MKAQTAKEICADCEKIFEGGPKAFLCPECRKKRVEEGKKKKRKEEGRCGKKSPGCAGCSTVTAGMGMYAVPTADFVRNAETAVRTNQRNAGV